jgi:hypothetical protein
MNIGGDMERVDVHNLQELDEILKSLKEITTLLGDSLDRNIGVKSRLYKALAENKISSKLSMESKLVELIGCGKGELVDEFIASENEVSKLKYHQRYAVEALNTKKHQNNLLPR